MLSGIDKSAARADAGLAYPRWQPIKENSSASRQHPARRYWSRLKS